MNAEEELKLLKQQQVKRSRIISILKEQLAQCESEKK